MISIEKRELLYQKSYHLAARAKTSFALTKKRTHPRENRSKAKPQRATVDEIPDAVRVMQELVS
jgi:hypothetical protein